VTFNYTFEDTARASHDTLSCLMWGGSPLDGNGNPINAGARGSMRVDTST
jgi:hypothetical protein